MREVEKIVEDIAQTEIPVLLVGESGTGKEVLARRIHEQSNHFDKPLAKITCASLSADKLSAELAGHLRSAVQPKRSESPTTLLFDELADLDPVCQARLLRAMPDGESSASAGTIGSRIICSTTRDLELEARAGRFRNELYYRISGVCLRLPPLRERRDDIPALIDFLLAKYAYQLGRPQPVLRQESVNVLLDYSWPGNIRELENVVRKIVALGDDRLAVSELRSAAPAGGPKPAPGSRSHSLKAAARAASRGAERELILEALARTRWNRKRAAQELQISYKSLLYKLKQIGIEESEAN
ncbi:MAG: sigma-54-dependent Fis family transcriptional regulator [Acidobacteriota bacterium]|nr:sigma-54-dependent Fis family transcriptional regulator [Acidobacteriota bacterium]MDE3168502.1 sigma-54-dependent Fis family transcriptional regulator [Acidobacteriota bacterium]